MSNKLFEVFGKFHDAGCAAFGAENFFNLVLDEFFDVRAAGREILARVKVVGMLHEVFTNTSRQSKAQVRVDIDFADCGLCSFAELVFGNADSVFELSAVIVDDFDIFGDNGACAVKDNREGYRSAVRAVQERRFRDCGCIVRA